MNNLPNEDLVHIINKKLPAFLRIDNDVKRKRAELSAFHDQYMEYDIELHMNQGVRENMSQRIAEASQDFYAHQERTGVLLT